MLRGKDRKKYTFLVAEEDPTLKDGMSETMHIDDRWERREAWRKLAGRIARISVDVYAKHEFDPSEIAEKFGELWILKDGYYSSERGILFEEKCNNDDLTLIL